MQGQTPPDENQTEVTGFYSCRDGVFGAKVKTGGVNHWAGWLVSVSLVSLRLGAEGLPEEHYA